MFEGGLAKGDNDRFREVKGEPRDELELFENSSQFGGLGVEVFKNDRRVIRECPFEHTRTLFLNFAEKRVSDDRVQEGGEGASLSDSGSHLEPRQELPFAADVAFIIEVKSFNQAAAVGRDSYCFKDPEEELLGYRREGSAEVEKDRCSVSTPEGVKSDLGVQIYHVANKASSRKEALLHL